MQSFFPIDPIDVTPAAGSYQDVDCSALIPAGATGVLLHIVGDNRASINIALREKGGTGPSSQPIYYNNNHCWTGIGVDANRVFQAYITSTGVEIWLVAYTMAGVTWLTDAVDKSPGVLTSWEDIDCSVEAPGAIGLIFQITTTSGLAEFFGIQKKGSTDNRNSKLTYNSCMGAMTGCDASQVCQIYRESTAIHAYLIGYVTDGATFNMNATDLSLGVTGAWTDLAALPAGSCMGFINVWTPAHERYYGLRKGGSAETIVGDTHDTVWAYVECDASQIIEGIIETTVVDFWLVGYAEGPGVQQFILTITATPGGTTDPAPGNWLYNEGGIAIVTAIPAAGYQFVEWQEDGVPVSTNNPVNVLMDADRNIMAIFEEVTIVTHTLIIGVDGQGVTDPAPGSWEYNTGASISVTAIPDAGWAFDHWEGDVTGMQNPVSFIITADMIITAVFSEIIVPPEEFALTISVLEGGSTDPAPGPYTYIEGTLVTVTAIPRSNRNQP